MLSTITRITFIANILSQQLLHYTSNIRVDAQNVQKITSISHTEVVFPLSEWMHLKLFLIGENTLA